MKKTVLSAIFVFAILATPSLAQDTQQKAVNATSKSAAQAAATPKGAAQDEPDVFTNKKTKFSVTLPNGWVGRDLSQNLPNGIIARMAFEGPGAPSPSCIATVGTSKESAKISQANINKAIRRKQSVAQLRKNVAKGGQKVLKTINVKTGNVSGVAFELLVTTPGVQPNVRTFLNIFETPGRRWQIVCNTFDYEFDDMRPMFEEFINGVKLP